MSRIAAKVASSGKLRNALMVLGLLCSLGWGQRALALEDTGGHPLTLLQETSRTPHYAATLFATPEGTLLEASAINGPPTPPPGYDREARMAAAEIAAASSAKLLEVPAYTWVFGCSAVSAAMIAGYYDRHGYPKMYTGPTSGGVMPMDNSAWAPWLDGAQATYPNNPLVASHKNVDGRTDRGTLDDYWTSYNSAEQDPYLRQGWAEHTRGSAIGDVMKTSQSAYGNKDGETAFYTYPPELKLQCAEMPTLKPKGSKFTIDALDGTYGRKLFYEARGYVVSECYNQRTDNMGPGGYSFAKYVADIDAGHPVLLNLRGHTVVGVGYNTATTTIYIHDTWSTAVSSMPWGGAYHGMEMHSVSIVHLQPQSAQTSAAALLLLGHTN